MYSVSAHAVYPAVTRAILPLCFSGPSGKGHYQGPSVYWHPIYPSTAPRSKAVDSIFPPWWRSRVSCAVVAGQLAVPVTTAGGGASGFATSPPALSSVTFRFYVCCSAAGQPGRCSRRSCGVAGRRSLPFWPPHSARSATVWIKPCSGRWKLAMVTRR